MLAVGAVTSVSADGRFVAFYSNADNLVAGDTNSTADVFVHDRQSGETTRVNVSSPAPPLPGVQAAPGSFSGILQTHYHADHAQGVAESGRLLRAQSGQCANTAERGA